MGLVAGRDCDDLAGLPRREIRGDPKPPCLIGAHKRTPHPTLPKYATPP